MKLYKRVIGVMLLTLLTQHACTFHVNKHDPEIAAESAIRFAEAALIQRDLDKAYAMLDAEVRTNATVEQFKASMGETLLDRRPGRLVAREHEPTPGGDSMSIYLHGEDSEGELQYRVIMKGSAENGYAAVAILRGIYRDTSGRQPLQNQPSTR